MIRRLCIATLAVLALLASWITAQGQPLKPVGAFYLDDHAPAWMTITHLDVARSDQELWQAGVDCRERQRYYVLYIGSDFVLRPDFVEWLEATQERLHRLGVSPCIGAAMLGEEWYEHFSAGAFAMYGLDPSRPDIGIPIVRDFMGQRYAELKALTPWPGIWLTTLANNDPRPGLAWWRPVPRSVDILALDAYVAADTSILHGDKPTFDKDVAPVLQHAINTTQYPIVIVPQWFRSLGRDMWRNGPSRSDLEKYAQWHHHPRVIATLGFLWTNEFSGLYGLPQLGVDLHWLGSLYEGGR